jgi:membrane protein
MQVLTPADAWTLVKRSARGWVDDAAPSMGAALAFYTLFSLAPVLLLSIAIAGFFMGRDQAQDVMIAQLTQLVGENAALGIEELLDAAGARGEGKWPALIGMVALAIGATTVFSELRADLDRIWRCSTKKARGVKAFLRTRVLSFGLVVSIGFLLLVSLVVSAALSALGDHWFAGGEILVRGGEFVTSFAVITVLFAMIFKWLPTTRIAWGDVWVGAAVTSLLFWLGKFLIGFYIGRAAVGSAFGAAGTLVVLIVWVYYSAQVFFLGAEFTREYARLHGSKQGEHYLADRRRTPGEPVAANEDLIERAEKIVRGKDPVLVITK